MFGVFKANKKVRNGAGGFNFGIVPIYRWLIFLLIAILCISTDIFTSQPGLLLKFLGFLAAYIVITTVYLFKIAGKYTTFLITLDVIMLMVSVFFSKGSESELYVFILFIITYYGVFNKMPSTLKMGLACSVFYSVVCILSGVYFGNDIDPAKIAVVDIIILSAAFAVTRINYELRKNVEMRKKESRIARTDRLTGLANRHYFDQRLKEEAEYAAQNDAVLNILIFDLDNFKGFNDTYGHISGDKLLILFADIIRQCIRRSDIPVRFGGEEFVVLIRDMDIIIAKSIAERIRRQLEKQRIHIDQHHERQRVTVSCGIAQFPLHSKNIAEIVEKADRALYHAKQIGKNIVVCYDDINKSRNELEIQNT